MLAKATLVGHTGRDIELKNAGNSVVANVPLATTFSHKNANGDMVTETSWHRVVVFGRMAENMARYVGKGSIVAVTGRIRVRKYTKDGQDHTVTEIVADDVTFVQTKEPGGGAASDATESQQHAPAKPSESETTSQPQPQNKAETSNEPALEEGGGWDGIPY